MILAQLTITSNLGTASIKLAHNPFSGVKPFVIQKQAQGFQATLTYYKTLEQALGDYNACTKQNLTIAQLKANYRSS